MELGDRSREASLPPKLILQPLLDLLGPHARSGEVVERGKCVGHG